MGIQMAGGTVIDRQAQMTRDRRNPMNADLYSWLRLDYQRHNFTSRHVLFDLDDILGADAATTALAAFDARVAAEVKMRPFTPRPGEIDLIEGEDSILEAFIRIGSRGDFAAFSEWVFRATLESNQYTDPGPRLVMLAARDEMARALAAMGVRGLAYSCDRCRTWMLEDQDGEETTSDLIYKFVTW